MQTNFSEKQLADPDMAASEKVIRKCVHCGFCTATCPTYVLLGDELDSPRGRIYQIQNMLESQAPPTPETVKHVDRCLSCLSCMTTCPSGVNYMHLVDHARAYIEEKYDRPLPDKLLRAFLAAVMTRPWLFKLSTTLARTFAPLSVLAPGRLKAIMRSAPPSAKKSVTDQPGVFPAQGRQRMRVALLSGCVQPSIAPTINAAAISLLNRHGVEVVVAKGAGCCGALPHHLGKTARSHALAKAEVEAWTRESEGGGLDAIVVTTSGCGTTIKDYGFMFRDDPVWSDRAAKVAGLACDITEMLARLTLQPRSIETGLRVAYHSACSLQHGQNVRDAPKHLLRSAGFQVVEAAESHLCCGSAGAYSLLQPEISGRLLARKVSAIEATRPDVIATGNIGCLTQIGSGTGVPVVHTVELLNWATGGDKPRALKVGRRKQ